MDELTSTVPLSYLAGTPELFTVLQSWSTPALATDVLGGELSSDDAAFVATLLNVGILPDATDTDPIHATRPEPFHGGGEPASSFAVMLAAWESFRAHAAERGSREQVVAISRPTRSE